MARPQETLALPSKNSPLPVHVRWMIRRDMNEVLAIEQQAFSSL
jgi:hypothetical protein